MNKKLLTRIGVVALKELQRKRSIEAYMLGLGEEFGELCRAIGIEDHKRKKKLEESSISEAADVVIAAIGAFVLRGGNINKLEEAMNKKVQKWEKSFLV